MKKIISLLLLLSLLFSFIGCSSNDSDNNNDTNTGNNDQSGDGGNNVEPVVPTIVVPEYKDYGRGSVNFSEITYSRPDLNAIISAFNNATDIVTANEVSVNYQINAIKALEAGYSTAESMYALTEIYAHRDSSVEFWQKEFEYVSTNYPAFTKSVEDLIVACAKSEHRSTFESDYYGYSLEKYANGGIYTDELVSLLESEAKKEAEYASLSTATIEIEYKSVGGFELTGTVDEVYAQAAEKYGADSAEYKNATLIINNLYAQRLLALSKPIYVDLLKIRRLIADELGYSSYISFAYRNMGYEYTEQEMLTLLDSIGKYISPVAETLNAVTFSTYFQKNNQPRVNEIIMINNLYSVYGKVDGDFKDAYSYMIQHGLFDIAPQAANRYSGAFTTYIDSNASPFVFMSTSGFLKDYMSLSHEFGHFYDAYVNNGNDSSLDLAEVSSQGLEYLTLLSLRNKLKSSEYEYLEYLSIYETLNSTLLEQSFYAKFEHMAYRLSYDEIDERKLNEIAREAFADVFGRELEMGTNAFSYVLIPHTILYPCYVESYVSSAIPALEIFFMESYRTGNTGAGLEVYKTLVNRDAEKVSFKESLANASLSSPFDPQTVKNVSDNIYYHISGKHYYTESNNEIGAA